MRSLFGISATSSSIVLSLFAVSCGGGASSTAPAQSAAEAPPPAAEVAAAEHACGSADTVHTHDVHKEGATEALVPCSANGKGDYSGLIKVETIPDGVHITISATDDDVDNGKLGSDVKTRDAVIVYPKGKGEKAIEVPLVKTATGYTGDKVVLWDDLDKLNDGGTKLDIAVFDHDKNSGAAGSEELHVQVSVSTGKSCEKAQDENPQTLDMSGKGGSPDLTNDQLGAPFKNAAFLSTCGLTDSADADLCVAVKNGKALGVTINVTPKNNKVAACIDRATRKIAFPASPKLDVVKEHY
jgi:hypothetical protein